MSKDFTWGFSTDLVIEQGRVATVKVVVSFSFSNFVEFRDVTLSRNKNLELISCLARTSFSSARTDQPGIVMVVAIKKSTEVVEVKVKNFHLNYHSCHSGLAPTYANFDWTGLSTSQG